MVAFVVDSALEVPVFLFVTLLETLEVVELVHEIGHLVFEFLQCSHNTTPVEELCFFILQNIT